MATPPKDKTTRAKPVAKVARPGAVLAKPTLVSEAPVAFEAEAVRILRKKELFDSVVEKTGAKKRDVKPVVEAALEVIAAALAAEEMVVLPFLGNARVVRRKDTPRGEALIVRRRQPNQDGAQKVAGPKNGDEALAEADD